MSYVLNRLNSKKDIDNAIKSTEDKVLVLRFGRESDAVCMQLDHIVSWIFHANCSLESMFRINIMLLSNNSNNNNNNNI